MKRQWTAMRTQANATYGLNLSPIRANFQNVPRKPVLFLSKRDGQIDLKYAHVQTASRSTVSNDWKWNKADIFMKLFVGGGCTWSWYAFLGYFILNWVERICQIWVGSLAVWICLRSKLCVCFDDVIGLILLVYLLLL